MYKPILNHSIREKLTSPISSSAQAKFQRSFPERSIIDGPAAKFASIFTSTGGSAARASILSLRTNRVGTRPKSPVRIFLGGGLHIAFAAGGAC